MTRSAEYDIVKIIKYYCEIKKKKIMKKYILIVVISILVYLCATYVICSELEISLIYKILVYITIVAAYIFAYKSVIVCKNIYKAKKFAAEEQDKPYTGYEHFSNDALARSFVSHRTKLKEAKSKAERIYAEAYLEKVEIEIIERLSKE